MDLESNAGTSQPMPHCAELGGFELLFPLDQETSLTTFEWLTQCGLFWWLSSKESACKAGAAGDVGLIPWVREDPLEEGMATRSSILA